MSINTKKMVLAAMFLALGMVLPFATMQVPTIGNMLLPMHLPVLLCGFICGASYGAVIGFAMPLLRSVMFGMPVLMPTAITMSLELLFYGLMAGVLYGVFKNKRFGIYLSLIPAMLIGRIAWGITAFIVYNIIGIRFTWHIFFAQAFVKAVPGIVIQLVLIPVIVIALRKMNLEVSENNERTISD